MKRPVHFSVAYSRGFLTCKFPCAFSNPYYRAPLVLCRVQVRLCGVQDPLCHQQRLPLPVRRNDLAVSGPEGLSLASLHQRLAVGSIVKRLFDLTEKETILNFRLPLLDCPQSSTLKQSACLLVPPLPPLSKTSTCLQPPAVPYHGSFKSKQRASLGVPLV